MKNTSNTTHQYSPLILKRLLLFSEQLVNQIYMRSPTSSLQKCEMMVTINILCDLDISVFITDIGNMTSLRMPIIGQEILAIPKHLVPLSSFSGSSSSPNICFCLFCIQVFLYTTSLFVMCTMLLSSTTRLSTYLTYINLYHYRQC